MTDDPHAAAFEQKWIVLVMSGGGPSWSRCYGPFASYDAAIAWAKANQYDDPNERGIFPIRPVQPETSDD